MTHAEFAQTRADFEIIARWIEPNNRVLDLGCGDGALLKWLRETRPIACCGVELDDHAVLEAVANNIPVIQSDLENGLQDFAAHSFDKVILSRTLQTVRQVEVILSEMLRVADEAIVSFPNFAYWKNLKSVLKGKMPVSEDLPYSWHDSPNVRFFTLADFEALCDDLNIQILEKHLLNADGTAVAAPPEFSADDVNFLTSLVVCRLGRAKTAKNPRST